MFSFSFPHAGLQKALSELTVSKLQVEGRPHRWDLLAHTLAVMGCAPSMVCVSEQVCLLSTDPPWFYLLCWAQESSWKQKQPRGNAPVCCGKLGLILAVAFLQPAEKCGVSGVKHSC